MAICCLQSVTLIVVHNKKNENFHAETYYKTPAKKHNIYMYE